MHANAHSALRTALRPRSSFSVGRPDIAAGDRPGAILIDLIKAGKIAPAVHLKDGGQPIEVETVSSYAASPEMRHVGDPSSGAQPSFDTDFEDELDR